MDIYILRDGQQTGPFSLETTKTLLQQGAAAAGDLAWRPGMPKWVPLKELLSTFPDRERAEVKPGETPAEKPEPVTPKQKALLDYLGIVFPADLTKDHAAVLVNDAMEDPKNATRLGQWNEDRLRLHPDLFAAESQAKKENRANHFFELCQTIGADYFEGITKAHCQVLVGFLDVKFPHWDAREAEAADHYFFPAVAEKFPQLVQKQWRGRLQYADGQKVAAEIRHKSPTTKLTKPSGGPFVAILRGVVIGGVILGVLYLAVYDRREAPKPAAPPEPEKTGETKAPPAAIGSTQPTATPVAPSLASTQLPPPPPQETATPVPVTATPTIPEPTTPSLPTAPATPATVVPPAIPESSTNPVAMAANPTSTTPPADPAMSPTAMTSSALNTAPMASLPGTEPPIPVSPAPSDPLPPAALTIPPLPTTATPATPEPAPASTARTNLLTTKPVEIQLAYGKMTLPPGTPVKLVGRQGALLKVNYRNSVITIPATSTDLE